MRLSSYNNLVEHEDGTLLCNLVTGTLIVLQPKALQEYRRLENGDFSNTKFATKLGGMGFVVNEEDERVSMRKRYEEIVEDCRTKHFSIVLTDQCNLGCHYCYEDKQQWIKMSPETTQEVQDFCEKFLDATPTTYLGVSWYGGEPTMNLPALTQLSKFFKKYCDEHGIRFHQQMTTNGTNFTDQIADLVATELGIQDMQITVDGFKEDHDKSRPFLTSMSVDEMSDVQVEQRKKLDPTFSLPILGQAPPKPKQRSSYDVIMKAIPKLVERGVFVKVRMNVNMETIKRVDALLEEFYEKGLFSQNEKGGLVHVYAAPIFDGGCGSNNECYSRMRMQDFAKEVSRIRDWYLEKKITHYGHQNNLKFTGETCTANKRWEWVINPDGTLAKCWHHAADPTKSVGHVSDIDLFFDYRTLAGGNKFHAFNPFTNAECYDCPVLPMCMGGCKANNKIETDEDFADGCATTRFTLKEEITILYESSRRLKKSQDS